MQNYNIPINKSQRFTITGADSFGDGAPLYDEVVFQILGGPFTGGAVNSNTVQVNAPNEVPASAISIIEARGKVADGEYVYKQFSVTVVLPKATDLVVTPGEVFKP